VLFDKIIHTLSPDSNQSINQSYSLYFVVEDMRAVAQSFLSILTTSGLGSAGQRNVKSETSLEMQATL
jgi:hypothetical protein